ncbi:MAG: DUF401 family protein [Desulfurococcaceae archaeon]
MNPCLLISTSILLITLMLVLKIPVWLIFLTTGLTMILITSSLNNTIAYLQDLISDPNTWDLVSIMFLIATLVNLYRRTGFVKVIGEELIYFIKKPVLTTITVPAILGLLPVPGGAIMSAPIVDSIGSKIGLDYERKLFINVWFRHVIFIIYPLSSVLVLTSVLTGQNLWSIIIKQIPVALLMLIIGYAIGFYRLNKNSYTFSLEKKSDTSLLVKVLTPLLSTVILAIILSPIVDGKMSTLFTRLSLIISTIIGIALLMIISKTNLKTLFSTIQSKEVVELVLIGFTSMFLRTILKHMELSGIQSCLPGFHPLLIIIGIPVIFSLIGGLVSSSIALSIPIVASLMKIDLEIASLIYLSAFMGYLVSPLHLCYVYSAQYYKVPVIKGYKYLLPSVVSTLVLTLIIYELF